VKAAQLAKAFPQFSTVNEQRDNTGRVLYHSLQARLQKRLSQGLQLVANYTHSKSMQYQEYSAVNVRKWRTISPIDYPNMLNVFVTYELPFGRGKQQGTHPGYGGGRMVARVHHALSERRSADRHGH
jgi:hypothetical protein